MKSMDTKASLLKNSLLSYFDTKVNMESFTEILQEKSLVSLRMIDWFVTKYAKNNSTQYSINGKSFIVYSNYKSQLKAYSKRQMDPFCRRDRITLVKHDIEIITTIGQMNFFRWAIENGILKYIYENYESLEKAMKSDNKQALSRKKIPIKHKRNLFLVHLLQRR